MFDFFLIAQSGVVEQLKVGTHFRHDFSQFITKRLRVAHEEFCFLGDRQILFDLLQRVAFAGIFEIELQGFDSWFKDFSTLNQSFKTDVPFFVDAGSDAVRFEILRIQLQFDLSFQTG